MSAPGSRSGAGFDGDAGAVRRRQLVLFSVIAAVVLALLAFWLTAGGDGRPVAEGGIDAELAGPDTAEKVWTRRSEARLGGIETDLREIRHEARTLRADNDRRDLLEIVEARHGRRSILIASQIPVENWPGVIGEPTIADAVLDRIVHNAYRIELEGESQRKRNKPPPLDGGGDGNRAPA